MSLNTTSNCTMAAEVHDSLAFHFSQWSILATSVATILFVLVCSILSLRKWILSHSTTELIYGMCCYSMLYASCQIFNQAVHLHYRYTAADACEMQIPKRLCMARFVGTSVVPSFVVLQVAITVQRALSSFIFSARTQRIVSRGLIACSLLYALGYGIFTYWPEPLDGVTPYCSSITQNSKVRVLLNIHIMFAVDVVNICVSLSLWRYNVRKLATRPDASLKQKFNQTRDINIIIRLLPLQIAHTLMYAYLFVVYALRTVEHGARTIHDQIQLNIIINVYPYYVCICPLILALQLVRDRWKRKNIVHALQQLESRATEEYFSALRASWDVVPQKSN